MPVARPRALQGRAVLALVVTCAALFVAPGIGSAARADKPPPHPTDGQIAAAAQQKAALAGQVGQLGAQVADMQSQLRQLTAAREMAEQNLANALSLLEDAKDGAQTAAASLRAAKGRVVAAQRQFSSYVQATYMNGDLAGTTGSLLTADDPNVVLQTSALQSYESDHQLDAISNLKSATIGESNANAKARLAVSRQKRAASNATNAEHDADQAVIAALARTKQLNASLQADQVALQQAQYKLAVLNDQKAAYVKYEQHQALLRAQALARKIAAEKAARLAAQRERARLAAAAKAEAARERAEQRKHQGSGGSSSGGSSSGSTGGSSSGSGGGSVSNPPAPTPSGGSWSASKGRQAVNRAMQYLGWTYAWAGGNASGPTYGVCAGDGAFNDCHIRGFDCSGLTLYGWAPFLRMPHYAKAQYSEAGSYHPSIGNLKIGDLLFWSSNGSVSGIHHVAMYVGGGQVIQAPESGSIIQITAVDDVDWGYFGATRPLT